MRKSIIAGNWKMYKTLEEAKVLACKIKDGLAHEGEIEVVICPPFPNLFSVYEVIKGSPLKLGAQDLFWEDEGAFTGEVSASMLVSCGCKYVIVGHSERRKYFGETNEEVNKKIKSGLREGLTPIVCVGEVLKEREDGKTLEVVESQLEESFRGLGKDDISQVTIAYEPVWAIGTGKTATPLQAEEVQRFIREWLGDNFSQECAQNIPILYGGSVKPENISSLMKEENIDGALVGGASLRADYFLEIIKGAKNV